MKKQLENENLKENNSSVKRWKRLIVDTVLVTLIVLVFRVIGRELGSLLNMKNEGPHTVLHITKPEKKTRLPSELEDDAKALALLNVDHLSLKHTNEDLVGWLYAPGGTINYAVVKGEDNNYYRNHLFDKTPGSAGALFVDYRNTSFFCDNNTIIYGQNMKDGSMFASLLEYKNQEYYNKHPIMYFYTFYEWYKLELIAGYTTSEKDLIYSNPQFYRGEDIESILEHVYQVSDFDSGITIEPNDYLMTLSTWVNDSEDARYVVIARLVKID